MRWLKKLLGKQQSHEDWLAEHPGKDSAKHEPPPVDHEQEARSRAKMEGELDDARKLRDNE